MSINSIVYENEKKKFNIWPLIILLGLYEIGSIVGSFALSFFIDYDNSTAEETTYKFQIAYQVALFISKLVPTILIFSIFKKRCQKLWHTTIMDFRKSLMWLGLGYVLFLFTNYGLSLYSILIEKFGFTDSANEDTIRELFYLTDPSKITKSVNYVILFLTIVVCAPIEEEFLFRELIFKAFKKTNVFVVSLIASTVFFFIHWEASFSLGLEAALKDLSQAPIYFLSGYVLCLVYYYSGCNFYVSSSIHMINNFLGFMTYFRETL